MTTTHPHENDRASGVVAVHADAEIMSRQGLPAYVGVSAGTAGATSISMSLVVIPAGGAADPHRHQGFETAIYLLRGRVRTRYGTGLRASVVSEAGEFLYIAPDVPHQPVNLSDDEPALALVARNTAEEQESVVLYDPDDDAGER